MFDYFFVTVPSLTLPEIIIHVVGMLGAILSAYGVFLEEEKRQDAVFLLGGSCLLVFALLVKSYIFIIASGLFTLASLIEFVSILRGRHHHHPMA